MAILPPYLLPDQTNPPPHYLEVGSSILLSCLATRLPLPIYQAIRPSLDAGLQWANRRSKSRTFAEESPQPLEQDVSTGHERSASSLCRRDMTWTTGDAWPRALPLSPPHSRGRDVRRSLSASGSFLLLPFLLTDNFYRLSSPPLSSP